MVVEPCQGDESVSLGRLRRHFRSLFPGLLVLMLLGALGVIGLWAWFNAGAMTRASLISNPKALTGEDTMMDLGTDWAVARRSNFWGEHRVISFGWPMASITGPDGEPVHPELPRIPLRGEVLSEIRSGRVGTIMQLSAGWPLRFQTHQWVMEKNIILNERETYQWGALIASIVIAAMVGAVLGALLSLAFGLVRRAFRRHDGDCLTCGYSRAGLAHDQTCPECGVHPAPPAGT